MTEVNDVAGDISLNADKESGFGDYAMDVAKNTPGVETAIKGVDTVSNYWQGLPDDPDAADVMLHGANCATDTAAFIAECGTEAATAVLDPVGWLVGHGLDFLLNLITPLQDALHAVTGDGPALEKAAQDFQGIGDGLVEYADEFRRVADEALADWNGDAAGAAKNALADFSKGIDGVSTSAGGVVEILKLSSMLMKVIEEVIKAIITEIVSWLIALWVPALAAAVPTAGASTAAAGAATAPKAAATISKVTSKLGKLGKILDDIFAFFQKFGSTMVKLGKRLGVKPNTLAGKADELAEITTNAGKIGKIAAEAGKAGAGKLAQETIGIDPTSPPGDDPLQAAKLVNDHYGKLTDNTQGLKEAADGSNTGSGASAEETEDNLRM
ncbi:MULTISPECIES: hypothetical protein [Prauserella salsuginis group]|uniref:Type VII secretion system (Wss) protein ESAT-6 n=2 Tax=Prauserella salsuginis group TaxID=2893672 RepID=A0A839XHD5_9PSEU|nr:MULTISPECIES: hypothetical protein [Prauserella salsuginis group]MBB3662161.1 hypothetical protein [Prauserella sediminis]MCR3719852.1 hypothetical protein [Prauserella flava]MCR3736605.1 hypothetical protein [Prauserella salsuginis]